MIGLIGKKCGMTRKFLDNGTSLPITIVEIFPNYITQIKQKDNDGYNAVQLAAGDKKSIRLNKAIKGHFAKAQVGAKATIKEFRISDSELVDGKLINELVLGAELKINQVFVSGQKVDIQGITKGRGFSGVVRRHNFATQDMSHGNSLSHRAPGSIGQNQTPGRVFKGKRMAGQYGNQLRSILNLEILEIDFDRNLLLIKGAIPGWVNGNLIIRPAVKKTKKQGK